MFGFGDKPQSIDTLIDTLPQSGATIYALKALDFVVPGEWENITRFDDMLKKVTGETDLAFLAKVRQRALDLYNTESEGYQTAVKIYSFVDSSDKMLGAAALANKVAESVSFLSFMDKITPKADNAQAIDLAVKLVAEIVAFTRVSGIPGDGIADFVRALAEYGGESKIRMAALVCFDGVLPLGADFLQKVGQVVGGLSGDALGENAIFQKISGFIPSSDKLGYVKQSFEATKSWMGDFATKNQISGDKIKAQLSSYIEIADDKLDYVAGFIDMATDYYQHTGYQTVAARLIERAVNEV
jgi:hypothetical protein